MTSKQVVFIHTSFFILFVLFCLSSPILAIYFTDFFESVYFLPGVVLFLILMLASWKIFGQCPFTVWEKNLRVKESREVYSGTCLSYYTTQWFGWKISGLIFDWILILLVLIPVAVGVYLRYIN